MSKHDDDNRANQLNREHDAWWQSRGNEGRPSEYHDGGDDDDAEPTEKDSEWWTEFFPANYRPYATQYAPAQDPVDAKRLELAHPSWVLPKRPSPVVKLTDAQQQQVSFHPGLYVMGGPTCSGKTFAAQSLAEWMARDHEVAYFFINTPRGGEMSTVEFETRIRDIDAAVVVVDCLNGFILEALLSPSSRGQTGERTARLLLMKLNETASARNMALIGTVNISLCPPIQAPPTQGYLFNPAVGVIGKYDHVPGAHLQQVYIPPHAMDNASAKLGWDPRAARVR